MAVKEANAWGLYDVHGNVAEWCWDTYAESYPPEQTIDYDGSDTGSFRVLRGGGFSSTADDCRSASRNGGLPGSRNNPVGFRLVRTLTTPGYPTVAVQEKVDYSLPSWVTPEPYSGYAGPEYGAAGFQENGPVHR